MPTYRYPRPSLTVDCVVFGIGNPGQMTKPELQVLLIRRADEPFKACWALPGGFVNVRDDGDQGEDIEDAARRELEEETGIKVDYLEQLCTFGKPGRDPRGRVVSVAWMALVRTTDHVATAGSDAKEAHWFPLVDALPWGSSNPSRTPTSLAREPLAFDHIEILQTATDRLRAKVRYAPIGFNLLPAKFTLTQLRELYEAILGRTLDKRNFSKRMLAMGILVESGVEDEKYKLLGPAATLYKFDKRAYDRAVKGGFNFEV